VRWIEAEDVEIGPEGPRLSQAQRASWRERGFALVQGLFPPELLEEVEGDARALFPAVGSKEAEAINDFGSSGLMHFPAESRSFNRLTLHPDFLRAVASLLAVPVRELRLTQSELWPKYGRQERSGGVWDNDDQRMHCDYPNHTLTHPPPWEQPEAVEAILYYSDEESCGGATGLVAREGPEDPAYAWPRVHMPGVGALPWQNDRESVEALLREQAPEVAAWRAAHLYPREQRVRYRPGTLLLYRHDTWHRGTPLRRGGLRLAQNFTFRRPESEWISTLHAGWAWGMLRRSRVMEELIAEASVDQRCVLGFPAPGHPYWTPETLAAVAARYGALGMDVEPYARAIPEH